MVEDGPERLDEPIEDCLLDPACIEVLGPLEIEARLGPMNSKWQAELGAIGELTGRPVETRHAEWRAGDQRWYVSDTRRFADATGWSPKVTAAAGVEPFVVKVEPGQGSEGPLPPGRGSLAQEATMGTTVAHVPSAAALRGCPSAGPASE